MEGLYWVGFIVFLASIVFSWRAVTSISVGLMIMVGAGERIFISRNPEVSGATPKHRGGFHRVGWFILAAFIYSIIQVLMTLVVDSSTLPQLQTKAGILAIPLAVYLSNFINRERGPLLFHALAILLIIAFLYCLTVAGINFNGGNSEFFYHDLVSPINGHAVYISIYTFTTLVFLMEAILQRKWVVPKNVHALLAVVLVIFLVLLASKLVIAFFCLYLLYFIYSLFRNHRRRKQFAFILLLLAIANGFLLFSTENPVKERFSDLKGKFEIRDKNDPSEYLNGLQFRLLQWKIVPEILSEKDKWLTGVGISNSQSELNRKYIARNLYQGDGKEDRGYLHYNSHNQFLQDLMQTGLPGLLGFVFLCIVLVLLCTSRRSAMVLLTISLILVYAIVESLLETQYGIVIFCFFPLLAYLSVTNKLSKKKSP